MDAFNDTVRGAFLCLFHLLERDLSSIIGFEALHINFTRLIPVSHPLLIRVLVACFREMSYQAIRCVWVRSLSDGAALIRRFLNLGQLLFLHQYFLSLDVDHLDVHWSVDARCEIVIIRSTHAVFLYLNLILAFAQVASNVLESIFAIRNENGVQQFKLL